MSLTKETIGAAADRGRTRQAAADSSKPQPVCIEVPVMVQGVRPATDPGKREPFTESARTVLVFANGAVLRLGTPVNPGQLIFLTNEHTKKEVVCQVVRSKTYQNVAGYIELEFTEPNLGFWGISFPGERSEPPSEPQAPAVPLSSPRLQEAAKAEPLPQKAAGAKRPAASAPAFPPPLKPPAPLHPELIQPKVPPSSRAEDATSIAEPLVFSRSRKVAAAAPPAPSPVEYRENDHAVPAFGSRSLFEEEAEMESAQAKPRRLPVGALIAAGLILAVAGGGWYWWRSSGHPSAASSSLQPANGAVVVTPPLTNTQTAPSVSSSAPDASKAVEASAHPSAPAPVQPQPVNSLLTLHESARPAEKPAESREPANTANKKSPAVSNFHLSAPHTGSAPSPVKSPELTPALDSAPAIPSVAGESVSPLVGASTQPAVPKPELPSGGELKQARLVSSTPPVYPPLARTQRVEGDVKLDALIDASGRVTTIKVISGPVLLQQAAVAAVRLWKYESATLNGTPTPMHLTVTVKFRLR